MGIDEWFWGKPKYPVIDPNPPFTKVVNNIAARDKCIIVASAGFSLFIACVSTGKAVKLPAGSDWKLGMLLMAFVAVNYIESHTRLMGFFPTDGVVYEKQGLKPQYQVIDPNPSFAKVVDNFTPDDYFHITANTGVCAFFASMLGVRESPKRMKMKIVAVGVLGVVASGLFLDCYKISRAQLMGFLPGKGEVTEYEKQGFKN